jgi:geranylgeranyl reductase family protein
MMYDCVIVGAGPAGGSAAYHLAKAGRSVLIVERESLPRYKPCGGGVAPIVQEWFDFDFSPAISLKVQSSCFTWEGRDRVDFNLDGDETIWMVRRDKFDYFLVQQAIRQGAELQDKTKVIGIEFKQDHWQLNTEGEPLTGRYLIAADGARGQLWKWLGFKKRKFRTAGALEAEIPVPNSTLRTVHFEFGMVQQGYIWNFPKADGYSIGVGTFRGSKRQDFKAILANYTQLFETNLDHAKLCGHPIYLWDGDQTLHTQNAILAGEAACVVDPFTAEGIRPSMFSGIKAAQAIDKALAGNINALDQYTEVMVKEWGADMKWAKRLSQVFYHFPKVSYQVGIKRPGAVEKMLQTLTGEKQYSEIARRGIQRITQGLIPG